ncbi:MAG: hypothetical protein OXE81_08455 [Gammaproteobacteria bacterium]|nr:hypothetical protein [Gammaproteobacteria bacterium]
MKDARSLALHCKIAHRIEEDPRRLEIARQQLEYLCSRYDDEVPAPYLEWRRIMQWPWEKINAFLIALTDDATRLRSSSPFTASSILTAEEREQIFEAFRA